MYAAGQYDKLKPIAESFSEKGGSIAIDALRYLYIIEKDTTKKAIWLDKLNVEARKQGIIGGSESLPESYLIIKDGQ
jgi:hypothetical protein